MKNRSVEVVSIPVWSEYDGTSRRMPEMELTGTCDTVRVTLESFGRTDV